MERVYLNRKHVQVKFYMKEMEKRFLHLHVEFEGQLAGFCLFHLRAILCAFEAGMKTDPKPKVKCVSGTYCRVSDLFLSVSTAETFCFHASFYSK